MPSRRDELLQAALDYLLEHGVAEVSLRPLGKAIGSSARLLIYHFESREGLLTAAMTRLRDELQQSFVEALARPTHAQSPLRSIWHWASAPERLRALRLLFEVQVLALQHPAGYAKYLEQTSSSWLRTIERALPRSPQRRAVATLCQAVIDGLLLELLSSGDRRRATAALDVFDGWLHRAGGSHG